MVSIKDKQYLIINEFLWFLICIDYYVHSLQILRYLFSFVYTRGINYGLKIRYITFEHKYGQGIDLISTYKSIFLLKVFCLSRLNKMFIYILDKMFVDSVIHSQE